MSAAPSAPAGEPSPTTIRLATTRSAGGAALTGHYVDLPRRGLRRLSEFVRDVVVDDVAPPDESADLRTVEIPEALADGDVLGLLATWVRHRDETDLVPSSWEEAEAATRQAALWPPFPLQATRLQELCESHWDAKYFEGLSTRPRTLYRLSRLASYLGVAGLVRMSSAVLAFELRELAQYSTRGPDVEAAVLDWLNGEPDQPKLAPLTVAQAEEAAVWVRTSTEELLPAASLLPPVVESTALDTAASTAAPPSATATAAAPTTAALDDVIMPPPGAAAAAAAASDEELPPSRPPMRYRENPEFYKPPADGKPRFDRPNLPGDDEG